MAERRRGVAERSVAVAERRRGVPWLQVVVLAALPLLITCHPFMYYASDSRRGYSRNIRPLACGTKQGDTGVCMFAWDCMKANGTHLGTCIDRFYFGSCCKLKPGTPKPVHTPMKTNFTIHATTPAPDLDTMPTDSDSANEIEDSLQTTKPSSQPSGSNLMQLMIGEATVKPDSGSFLPEMDETSTSVPVTGDQDESFAAVETPSEQELDQTLQSGSLPMQEIEQQVQHEISQQSQSTQETGEQEGEKVDFISDSQQIDQQVDVAPDPDEIIQEELESIDGQEEHQTQEGDDLESVMNADQDTQILPEEIEQETSSQSPTVDVNHIDDFVNQMLQGENEELDDTSDSVSVTEGQVPSTGGDTELPEQVGSLDNDIDQITYGDEEKLTSSSEQKKPEAIDQTSEQSTNEQPDETVQEDDGDFDEILTTEMSTAAEVSNISVDENKIETGDIQQDSDLEGDEQEAENEQDKEQTEIITEQTPDSFGMVASDNDDGGTTSVDEQTTEDYLIENSTFYTEDVETTTMQGETSIADVESDGEESVNQSLESSDPLAHPNLDDETIDGTTEDTFITDGLESTIVSTSNDDEAHVTESQVMADTTEAPEQESDEPEEQEQTDTSTAQDGIEIDSDDAHQEDSVQSATEQSVILDNEEDKTVLEQETEEINGEKEGDQQQIDVGSEPGITESSGVTVSHDSEDEQTPVVQQEEQVDNVEQDDSDANEQNESQNELAPTDQENPADMGPDSDSQIFEDATTPEESSTVDVIPGADSVQSDINTATDGADQTQENFTEEPDNNTDDLEAEVTQENKPAAVDSSSEISDATESTTLSPLTDGASEEQEQTTTSPVVEDNFIVPGVQIVSKPGNEVAATIPDKIEISTTESVADDDTPAAESTTENDLSISEQDDDDDMKQAEETGGEEEESTTESQPSDSFVPEVQSSVETTSPPDHIQTTEATIPEQVNGTSDTSIEITKPDSTGQVVIGIDAPLKNKTETKPESSETVFATQEDQILHRLNTSSFRDICGQPVYPSKRIVGGSQAAFGEWPWQVSLRQWRSVTYLHKCGAALVNENWAITAAHCVENAQPDQILLRLGEYDLERVDEPYGYLERKVQIIATHPQFDPRTFEYDLALLRFSEPVNFQPNIIPICIPSDDYDFIGDTGFVSGWGRLYEAGPLHSRLQMAAVPVLGNEECSQMFYRSRTVVKVPDIMMCAGYSQGKKDACEGDSGGPLVIQHKNSWMLAGVISWGIGCALPNQPGVYTRISAFRDWINKIIVF